jgi:tRNA/tmRNA/rRNA uracil-C5-methylase (TrmA/RlmC/RlmD family)
VSTEAVNAALGELRGLALAHPGALNAFSWLEVREATSGALSVLLEPRQQAPHVDTRGWLAALRARFVVAVNGRAGDSPELWQRFDLTDDTYMLSSPAGFVQVNWEVNRALIAHVLEGVAARGLGTFLDVYAGSGNFTLPLLRRGLAGHAVESNASAVAALREAARQQGLDAGGVVVADAALHAGALERQSQRYDLVLVDPPRAGLVAGLEPLGRLARRWFVMCSCNPVTLARDLGRLVALGFELEELRAFDMFPQTHHLESLAWLRAPAAPRARDA